MAYEITKACEIANKPYKPGDLIDEKETSFFPSVMKKVDTVISANGKADKKTKPAEVVVLTKAEMIEVINGLTPLSDDQKKVLSKLNVADLTAEMERVKTETKPAE